jgi:hypothetical protein
VTVERVAPQRGGARIRRSTVLPRVGDTPEEALFPVTASSSGESPAEKTVVDAPPGGGDTPTSHVRSPFGRVASVARFGSRARVVFVFGGAAVAVLLVTTPFLVTTSRGQEAGNVKADKPHSAPNSAVNPAAPAPKWPGGVPSPSVSTGTPGSAPPSGKPDDSKGKPPAKGKGKGKAPGDSSGAAPAGGGARSHDSSGRAPAANAPVHAAAAPGKARRIVSAASGRCIDVTGGKAKDGTPLEIWSCSGASRQKWTFRSDGSVRAMGLCMDVAWGSSDNGAVIQLVDCNGGAAQRFDLNKSGDLVNSGSGKCVDVKDKKTANGTRLQLWSCAGSSNQKWSAV